MNKLLVAVTSGVVFLAASSSFGQLTTVDFESVALVSPFNNGGPATNSAGFLVDGVRLSNRFTNAGSFSFWSGFALSRVADGVTAGFGNQYAAYPGAGAGGSSNYAVFYSSSSAFLELPVGKTAVSTQITNTTYAGLSMRTGDQFSKKFGGVTGNDPDFFSVTFTGYSGAGGVGAVTGSVPFVLADFRFADNSLDYIVDSWETLDLTGLGAARSIKFTFASSDVGQFGINTPTYFAIDNFAYVPEPGVAGLLVGAVALAGRRRR